jgi:transcriptional regulator with XRE-family HTH domain
MAALSKPKEPPMTRTPEPIDAVVGARVRDLRIQQGVSQSDLAAKIGVTFQQVQKYESGKNRISCSRLVAIAGALDAPCTYFLEGLDADQPTALQQIALPSRLIRAIPKLSATGLTAVVELATTLAAEPRAEAA